MNCDKCSKYKQKGYTTCPKCNISFNISVRDFYQEYITYGKDKKWNLSLELKKRFPEEKIITVGDNLLVTKTELEEKYPLLTLLDSNYFKNDGNVIDFGREYSGYSSYATLEYLLKFDESKITSPFTEVGRCVIMLSSVFQNIKKENKGKAFALLFGDLKS